MKRIALFALIGMGVGAVVGSCSAPPLNPCTPCGDKCVDLSTDSKNCGMCGNACAGGTVCSAGKCDQTCPATLKLCGSSCIDTRFDPANCGECGKICKSDEACAGGNCATVCNPGLNLCPGPGGLSNVCVDKRIDNNNCGDCGRSCTPGTVCFNGNCEARCAPNQSLCGTDGGTAYCANLTTDSTNCGTCGHDCSPGQVCNSNTCSDNCTTPLSTCGDAGVRFCANLNSDPNNCGACGRNCPAGQLCQSQACVQLCTAPLSVCSPDAGAPYCSNLESDVQNCGACGRACPAGALCNAGTCQTLIPETCGDVKQLQPDAGEGGYTLYFEKSAFQPYTGYCADMGAPSSAKTYLTLLHTDAGENFSNYNNVGMTPPPPGSSGIIMRWSKVRFDPQQARILTTDYRFAVNDGGFNIWGGTTQPYGTCGCCNPAACGSVNVDLRGLPFNFHNDTQFIVSGGFGTANVSSNRQVMNGTGGGSCGGLDSWFPVSGVAGIGLKYVPFTCASIKAANPGAADGVYSLATGAGPGATTGPLAYCDMMANGGGWTLAMKIDGMNDNSLYFYDSPLWTSSDGISTAVPDLSKSEAKYPPFAVTPLTQVRVTAVDPANNTRTMLMPAFAPGRDSLLAALTYAEVGDTRGDYMGGGVGDNAVNEWTTAMAAGTMPTLCRREGFNHFQNPQKKYPARVRIGVTADTNANCLSVSAYAGVGGEIGPNSPCAPDAGFIGYAAGAYACPTSTANARVFAYVWVK